ncbi:zinc finger protein 26 isoform X5 [Bicyclus anynana]|uniref:Zinc finger protein 26 isoform X5 n=1 Tax=Bicyclus anynana TaxID=110368 RepID=A0A6J1MZ21_BICAN|nr:zinc finger protein 26 isoform X5 [Bicyclus anynana]
MKMSKIKKPGQQQQCRCCLEVIGLKDLWTEYYNGDEREVYGEMVNECFAMPWEHEDSKREYICDGCVTRLRDAVSFRKEILHSDQLLKEHIKNEAVAGHSVKEEEMSDAEIETEYLSIDYLDEDGQHKSNSSIEIKIESGGIKEESIPSKSGRRYTEEDFKKCIEAVKSRKLSQTKASIIYHVPRTTIRHALASPDDGPRDGKVKKPAKATTNAHKSNQDEKNKHQDNITSLLKHTNATPIRCEKDSRYACCFCADLYREPAELKKHNIKKHQSDIDTIMTGKRLQDYLVKLDITGLKCNLCAFKPDSLEDIMKHLEGHDKTIHTDINNHIVPFVFDGDDLKCAICKTGFNTFRKVFLHMHTHYRNHVCDICAAGFINEKSFLVHYKIHKKGVFYCRFCHKEFETLSRMKSHESGVHTNSLRFKCSYCGERFTNSSKKMKHISAVHNVRQREIKCKLCDRVCSTMEALRVHTKRDHLMERRYECHYCKNKYYRMNELRNHIATHTGEREHLCKVCNKSFSRKMALANHIVVHNVDK